jgi:hypothetical protein
MSGKVIGHRTFVDGATQPVFEDEKGQFIFEDGERIDGVWLLPDDDQADRPLIVNASGNTWAPLERLKNKYNRHGGHYRRTVGSVSMDSKTVRPWQAKKVYARLSPLVGYLHRLRRRMEKRGFPPDDKLLQLTAKAWDAVYALSVEVDYLSCTSGVGRESEH